MNYSDNEQPVIKKNTETENDMEEKSEERSENRDHGHDHGTENGYSLSDCPILLSINLRYNMRIEIVC